MVALADRAATDRDGAADRQWWRAAKVGLGVFAVSRAGVVAVSVFAWIGEPGPRKSPTHVAWLWAGQWDSPWFIAIAEHGYQRTPDNAPAAFFPLYPLLIRIMTPLALGRSWVAALLVANLALAAALILLYRLTELELGREAAGRAVFYLVAFPTGFFLGAAYNESLFIALAVGTVYCLRRGLWWTGGLLSGLAVMTRSAGVLLVLAFAVEYTRQAVKLSKISALIGIPAGLGVVMLVDHIAYGDALAFSHAQARHWGRHLAWPWQAPLDALTRTGAPFTEIWTHNVLELGTVLGLAALLVTRSRSNLLGLALLTFAVSFPSRYTADIPYPLYSASRIGLEAFPAFMVLGALGRRPWVDRAVVTVFVTTQGILAAHFLHRGWVA
ncbi:mannosyltransferase family protein [Dactylosporangium matsuzakiense]|uniref:mannosyltransferase family protein n=1 Tax=Dactylosporangium matsuzakiense TaxID=53360 RepID=UPI0022F341A9|nr:mannosyltransferase family protein [Dactylosporangium matsuzakiense]